MDRFIVTEKDAVFEVIKPFAELLGKRLSGRPKYEGCHDYRDYPCTYERVFFQILGMNGG
jgi:hypothetical protein